METAGISIRRASPADAFIIAQLATTLGYHADDKTIAGRLAMLADSRSDLILVATDASRNVIGWLQAHAAQILESGFRVEITGLVIAPEQRRRGAGRALVVEAEQWAKTIGAGAVVVRSNFQRIESHAFYPALGYAATKTQNVYRKTLAQ
jgi:GNAT superfamily N-acetyltransferase